MRQVVGDVPLGGSPHTPIADYGCLSDCETCALVAHLALINAVTHVVRADDELARAQPLLTAARREIAAS